MKKWLRLACGVRTTNSVITKTKSPSGRRGVRWGFPLFSEAYDQRELVFLPFGPTQIPGKTQMLPLSDSFSKKFFVVGVVTLDVTEGSGLGEERGVTSFSVRLQRQPD